MNLCPRKSVGAVIRDERGRYLCLYRLGFPKGLAFIAGHLDWTDEDETILESPEIAVVREVQEADLGAKVDERAQAVPVFLGHAFLAAL